MKYIDAEKLIIKIKELNLVTKTYDEQVAFNNALAMVVEIITSLQQEQPEVVDLETEYKSYMQSKKDDLSGKAITINIKDLARHFYELGLKARNED